MSAPIRPDPRRALSSLIERTPSDMTNVSPTGQRSNENFSGGMGALRGPLDFAPGIGEALSAHDAVQHFREGEIGPAALSMFGAIPFFGKGARVAKAGVEAAGDVARAVGREAPDPAALARQLDELKGRVSRSGVPEGSRGLDGLGLYDLNDAVNSIGFGSPVGKARTAEGLVDVSIDDISSELHRRMGRAQDNLNNALLLGRGDMEEVARSQLQSLDQISQRLAPRARIHQRRK